MSAPKSGRELIPVESAKLGLLTRGAELRGILVVLAALTLGPGCLSRPPGAIRGKPYVRVTGPIDVDYIPEQAELTYGYLLDYQYAEMMPLLDDAAVIREVRAVGERVASASDRPHLKYTFRVVNFPGCPDAFAFPGYVYVLTSVLENVDTKDELAAVLAHEIAHVSARHMLRREVENYEHLQVLNEVIELAGRAGEVAFPGAGILTGMVAGEIGAYVSEVIQMAHSRDYEAEADRLGLRYLEAAGFNRCAMLRLLIKLEACEAAQQLQPDAPRRSTLLASHPPASERLAAVREMLVAEGTTC